MPLTQSKSCLLPHASVVSHEGAWHVGTVDILTLEVFGARQRWLQTGGDAGHCSIMFPSYM